METSIEAWLAAHGVPRALAPDSLMLVGLGAFLGGFLVLRRARRAGAPLRRESHALAIVFVAAWLGAALFELIWDLPALFDADRPEVDRNFYGGVLGGCGAAAAFLWWRGGDIVGFLDRTTLLWGSVLVSSRLGCFLEGCCYGHPTAGALGVRFPADSPAAVAHAEAGWIPAGAPSLPVHATQLYEAGLGVVATIAAACILRRRMRPGVAFVAWLGLYAAGRTGLDALRATVLASPIEALTRAQLLSIACLIAIAVIALSQHRNRPV